MNMPQPQPTTHAGMPGVETIEYAIDGSPMVPRLTDRIINDVLPPFIGPDDGQSAAHPHNVLMTALRKALRDYPSVTEMMVHQNGTVWFKSAKGTLPISEMFADVRNTVLGSKVDLIQILYFMCGHIMGATTPEQGKIAKDRMDKAIAARGSFNESILLNFGMKARAQAYLHSKGLWAINVRLSRSAPPPLEKIGLPQQAVSVLKQAARGLVLLTGPMAAGKTTTAQSLLQHLNNTRAGHIVTIEDPIETDLRPVKCLITPKEVGTDCATFHDGLKDSLRQAADVLLIGELRDADTIRTALAAAASGILVLATTHGDTCTGALSKMMTLLGAEAPGYYKVLSQNLVAVIRQAMLPSKDEKRWYTVADALMPEEGSQISLLIGEGKITELENHLVTLPPVRPQPGSAAPPARTAQRIEWVSMNEALNQLITQSEVSPTIARKASTRPKGVEMPSVPANGARS